MLAAYLASAGSELVRGRSTLELGAGLGLPSVAASFAGAAACCVTDRSEVALAALQRLCDRATLSDRSPECTAAPWTARITTRTLDWEDCAAPGFRPKSVADVVIAADCHYYSAALAWLTAAMEAHLAPGGRILLASREGRISLDDARALLHARGFRVVQRRTLGGDGGDHTLEVFEHAGDGPSDMPSGPVSMPAK